MKTQLKVGDWAPDFTALTNGGETFQLSAQRNRKNVVLYFYPKDDTPGCTVEARSFAELAEEFSEEDTVIVGVSLDSVIAHDRFVKKHDIPFILVSDEEGDVCSLYGALPNGSTCPERITFLINKDGRIARVFDEVNVACHGQEVLESLSA